MALRLVIWAVGQGGVFVFPAVSAVCVLIISIITITIIIIIIIIIIVHSVIINKLKLTNK